MAARLETKNSTSGHVLYVEVQPVELEGGREPAGLLITVTLSTRRKVWSIVKFAAVLLTLHAVLIQLFLVSEIYIATLVIPYLVDHNIMRPKNNIYIFFAIGI